VEFGGGVWVYGVGGVGRCKGADVIGWAGCAIGVYRTYLAAWLKRMAFSATG